MLLGQCTTVDTANSRCIYAQDNKVHPAVFLYIYRIRSPEAVPLDFWQTFI